jgi:hypothetical protein
LPIAAAIVAVFPTATAQALPPGFTLERSGSMHDFDYFRGGWNTAQHRLADARNPNSKWEDFPGTLCMSPYLEGIATVDELYFPTRKRAGLTLRTFDREKKQWTIYWVSSATGKLDPAPVVGGFDGYHGAFYSNDNLDGQAIKVRYKWWLKDHNHARWEQAFSFDDQTWQTNWTADFTRADSSVVCKEGKPRR